MKKIIQTNWIINAFVYKNIILTIISIAIGVAVFDYYFDFTIINPSNTSWIMRLQGDQSQHYLGSIAFRADEWHFPFTKTTYINYPEGVSIIYTDSNPLLAVIAKIFRFAFLPSYQYTGIWYLLCFGLQSMFGYFLIRKITNNILFSLISGLLFSLLPPQIHRTGHENLMAFWLITWGLYVYIQSDFSFRKKSFLFFVIITIASLTHAYLCVMVLFISGTWYIKESIFLLKEKNKKNLFLFISSNVAYGFAFVVILWCFGYFYNTPHNTGLMGFGYYSMNLIAPLNPMGIYSAFLNSIVVGEGQYEGFQYWGLGVILLFSFVAFSQLNKIKSKNTNFILLLISFSVIILLLKNEDLSFYQRSLVLIIFILYSTLLYTIYTFKGKEILILFIPASICFILALSNIVTLGNVVLFEYPLNDGDLLAGFFRTIRSSGRMFWVTTHVLILAALFILHKSTSAKLSIYILSLVAIIQMFDMYKVHNVIDSIDQTYESTLTEDSKNIILASENIKFIGKINMPVADFALLNNKPINQFYTVHQTGNITAIKIQKERGAFENNLINPKELLLFDINDLPINKEIIGEPFDQNFLMSTSLHSGKLIKSPNTIIKKTSTSINDLYNLIQSNNIVIIAAKDDAAHSLDPAFAHQLDKAYSTKLSQLKFRQSYYALFYNGKLISEKIGSDNFVDFNRTIENESIYIKSGGSEYGDIAQIKIKDFDYSLNVRGLNIVTKKINLNGSESISLINYDTFERSYCE